MALQKDDLVILALSGDQFWEPMSPVDRVPDCEDSVSVFFWDFVGRQIRNHPGGSPGVVREGQPVGFIGVAQAVEFVRFNGYAPPNCVQWEAGEEELILAIAAKRLENPDTSIVLLLVREVWLIDQSGSRKAIGSKVFKTILYEVVIAARVHLCF